MAEIFQAIDNMPHCEFALMVALVTFAIFCLAIKR